MAKKQEPKPKPPAGFQMDSNVTWGIMMLVLGYSGAFQDNSFALYLAGAAMLGWGIFRTVKPAKPRPKKEPKAPVEQKNQGSASAASDGVRETVESLVVAFILAFLFRTFEAEAFVIPTGSMAPTLLGRHKDVECEECGCKYRIGASVELDSETSLLINRIEQSVCPNCQYINNVRDLPPFPGDRIVVTKLQAEPERFDVIVFKYPEKPYMNYIKRCVGMPNETVMIRQGDLFRRQNEGQEWEILRKPTTRKQQAIQLPVYDDRYRSSLEENGWPARWAGVRKSDESDSVGGWAADESGFTEVETATYSVSAPSEQKWLRYRHFVPDYNVWKALADGEQLPRPRAALVSDFCGYNKTAVEFGGNTDLRVHGDYWVGDLTFECEVDIKRNGANPQLTLELIEGVNVYRAVFDTATGELRLKHTWEGEENTLATVSTTLKGTGIHSLRFGNVDNRLAVWVDEAPIDFGGAELILGDEEIPTSKDLCPAGIAAKDMEIAVSDIMLFRDIYYRDDTYSGDDQQGYLEVPEFGVFSGLSGLLHSPVDWYKAYSNGRARREQSLQRLVTYELGDDEYLMLGDNSPKSQDSRLFNQGSRLSRDMMFRRHAVPGSALVGKAFFVYWPHGEPFLNEGQGYSVPMSYHIDRNGRRVEDYPNHRFPFYPNVSRMRRIR